MTDILLFISDSEGWLYVLLGAAGLIYARLAVLRFREARRALFGLERDRAAARLRQALGMLAITLAGALVTFVLTTFVVPSLPGSLRGTPAPTISLLTTPGPETPTIPADFVSATALPLDELDPGGCLNPQATILFPVSGASLSGAIEIIGTADIPNFGFYKIEYRSRGGEDDWQAILAGGQTRLDESLGVWDTSLVGAAGEYLLRLVVADTAGNAPQPCVVPVRITPSS